MFKIKIKNLMLWSKYRNFSIMNKQLAQTFKLWSRQKLIVLLLVKNCCQNDFLLNIIVWDANMCVCITDNYVFGKQTQFSAPLNPFISVACKNTANFNSQN